MKIITGKDGSSIAILETDNCICRFIEESGRLDHDQNMLPLVLRHIKKGDVVIDVGSFCGDHTIAYARAVGYSGTVFAFEPSKDAYKCLVYNTESVKNIVVRLNMGLGSENKSMSVQKVETNDGMNYLVEGDDIEVVSLDSTFKSPKLNFIKIDCEGYELEVLKGGEKTIARHRPKMLIEINDMTLERAGISRTDIFNWLDTHGYRYENIYPKQGLSEYQMDIICFPK